MSELDPVILNEVTKVAPPILNAVANLASDVKALPTTPIGCVQFMPEVGADFTDARGSYYLRSGSAVTATSYPEAAALEHLKVSGKPAANGVIPSYYQIADNDAGTIVIATGDASNVMVSTNNGASWAAVAHSLTVNAAAVVWTGAHFVVAGNTASAIHTSYSTTGNAFTYKGSTTLSGSTAAVSTVRATWNGSIILIAGGGATDCCVTAPSATGTYTKRTMPVALANFVNYALSGSTILITNYGTVDTYSTTDGITFTKRTWPDAIYRIAFVGGLWLGGTNLANHYYYTTPDFISYTKRKLPFDSLSVNSTSSLMTHDSQRVYYPLFAEVGGLLWSADGISWKMRWTKTFGSIYKGFLLYPSTVTESIHYMADWNTPDYVGTGNILYTSAENSACATGIGYVRLK